MNRRIAALVAVAAALMPLIVWAQEVSTGSQATTSPDAMSDFTALAIIGGALTSVVTALINQSHWPSSVRLVVFFLLCTVTAGIDAYTKRQLDLEHWSRALIVVVASGWVTYLAARPALKDVEVRTTFAPSSS